MSGISIGRSHPGPCSGNKILKRCRNKEEADNVILIDADSENCENIVIIDIAESLPKKKPELHMLKKDEQWLFRNVINIDDDETPESSRPYGVNNASFCAGSSLNREPFFVASNFGNSSDGDCQFVHDCSTPFRLSKCKRTYSGNASTINHCSLDTKSECDLSDNVYPDYDVVEDFSGEVQAVWEEAFSRRMKGIRKIRPGGKMRDSTSCCINEGHPYNKPRSSCGTEVNPGKAVPGDNHRLVQEKATGSMGKRENRKCRQSHTTGDAKEMECSIPERTDRSSTLHGKRTDRSSTLHGKRTDRSSTPSCQSVDGSGKSLSSKSFLSSGQSKESSLEENGPLVPEIPFLNEAEHEEDNSLTNNDACIINNRERLKETDEYKRAMEEEWISRQQALQIQAEEAQNQRRLLKRVKAESMRLMDMERRQKQRLEEVRSIQKKDEENMSLKDTIRAEIRIELKKLEVGCQNMAFLLHSLGIRVDNWPNPSPQEVQVAYKRALLTFHPDRASRSDIRQLVEAEEKFKLINRMKEKFPPSS